MHDSSIDITICPHCYPEKINHTQEKFNSFVLAYINRPLARIFKFLTFNKNIYFTDRYLVATIILLRKFNKLHLQQDIKAEQTTTRLQLLWSEAQKRGLDLYSFSMYNRQLLSFLLKYKGRNYYFHYSPTTLLHKHLKRYKDPTIYDDKAQFKKIMLLNDFPHPEGRAFFSKRKAFLYGKNLGYPLVVKPAASTFSHHVSLQINDLHTLKRAIDIAKLIDCRIIVERFIDGDVHRMMFIDNKLIVCSKRTRACVIGDGYSTIDMLIDKFNSNPLRGKTNQVGFALYQIAKDAHLQTYLSTHGMHLNFVVEEGRKIYLSDKSNCSNGALVINVTEEVCAENIELFRKLHNALQIGVSAIDLICTDVSKPWYSQPFAFLENNSFPAIEPQYYPSTGKPVDVAKDIWDLVLYNLNSFRNARRNI